MSDTSKPWADFNPNSPKVCRKGISFYQFHSMYQNSLRLTFSTVRLHIYIIRFTGAAAMLSVLDNVIYTCYSKDI